MAAATAYLNRYNQDTGNWDTIQSRSTTFDGVLSDHFFDTAVPARWGAVTYQIVVTDGNGQGLGITSILAVALSR